MIYFQYEIRGASTQEQLDAEKSIVSEAISDSLKDINQEFNGLQISGLWIGGGRDLQPQFGTNEDMTIYGIGTTPREYRSILTKKPQARERMAIKINEALETLKKKIPTFHMVMAPQKPFGFTVEIQCRDPQDWEFMNDSISSRLRKIRPFCYGYQKDTIGPTTVQYFVSPACLTVEEATSLEKDAKEALKEFETSKTTITFRPDLDE
jgi:hypothetical protein